MGETLCDAGRVCTINPVQRRFANLSKYTRIDMRKFQTGYKSSLALKPVSDLSVTIQY